MSQIKEKKIAEAKELLTDDQKKLYQAAVDEGYRDEVCRLCGVVLLAFHSFIRCDEEKCPMLARDAKGNKKPSVLQAVLGPKG